MNKKAVSIVLMIFEVLAVISIIAITITFAKKAGESETAVKNVIASDISLMVNTLLSVPGDAVVQYPLIEGATKYVILLQQDHVSVWLQTENQDKQSIQTFFLPSPYHAEGAIEAKEFWCLEKKAKSIILRECLPEERVSV